MENNKDVKAGEERKVARLNLYEKIQAVSNEVRNIEKNMTVGKGNYAYKAVCDLDVVLAVKEAETKYRIVSIPVRQEIVKSEIVKSQKGDGGETINYVDIIKMTVRIIDLESPQDFIEVESFGRGLDTADKGFGKASTYARKYALLNAYKIATGEDPDKDKEKPLTAVKEDEKRDAVVNYMMTDNNYMQNILSYFSVGCVDDLGKKEINTIYSNLQKKGKL